MAHLILPLSGAGRLETASIRTVGMLWPPNPPCFQINFQVLSFPRIPSTWTMAFTQYSLEWRLLLLTIHSPLIHCPDWDMDIHLDKRSRVSTPPQYFFFKNTQAICHDRPFWVACNSCGEECADSFDICYNSMIWLPHAGSTRIPRLLFLGRLSELGLTYQPFRTPNCRSSTSLDTPISVGFRVA